MVDIQDLIDDAKCYQTIRARRWPNEVICPHCSSASVIKNGGRKGVRNAWHEVKSGYASELARK